MLADKWGIIPAVQPKAAAMLALQPRKRPFDIVYITPVPGIKTTISDVNKNSVLKIFILYRCSDIYLMVRHIKVGVKLFSNLPF